MDAIIRTDEMKPLLSLVVVAFFMPPCVAADNVLTEKEKKDGWILLFDGKTQDGWMTSAEKPSKREVEDGSINPHKCGSYMMVHQKQWENFILACDFKISKTCNSGIFVRTSPLKPPPGFEAPARFMIELSPPKMP